MVDAAQAAGESDRTPDEDPTRPAGATVYGDRYRVESELGRGGMGRVLRARDLRLDRLVAIKVLPAGPHTAEQRLRFEQEARAAGALNHPNILDVHDAGEQGGEPYIVSELLEGESLHAVLRKGPLSADRALELALQLASGLAAAHRKGIVHRDLKPENLFLTDEGRLKILDFGIAKLLPQMGREAVRTDTGAIMGTPAYMSPEQVRGEPADARSDVFACGAVLHEMVSRKPLFERATSVETAYAVLHDTPDGLPASAMSGVIARCLQKDPAARYDDAGGLVTDLDAIAHGVRTAAARRRRRRVTLIAAGLLLVTLPLAYAVRRMVRERQAAPVAFASSIAVLPFADMSRQRDQEYLADGIAEEILNALAKVQGLKVTGRTSSFAFKGKNEDLRTIAQKLGVAHLLEGSVRMSGEQLRITAQLISAGDGYDLWSETYDRKLTDLFAVQDEIARAVVAALKLKLVPAAGAGTRGTSNLEAFNQALLGRQFYLRWTPDDWQRARQKFQKAVDLDPGYAAAWAGLAMATFRVGAVSAAAPLLQEASAAADKAVALGPDVAAGYRARGIIRFQVGQWADGGADLKQALLLEPENADVLTDYARFSLGTMGRLPEAVAALRRAADLDPLAPTVWGYLGTFLVLTGDRSAGRAALERSLELSPSNAAAGTSLVWLDLLDGRSAEAQAAARRIAHPVFRLLGEAAAQHGLGHDEESQRALDELIAKYSGIAAVQVAAAYAFRGEAGKAFQWLEQARAEHDTGLSQLKYDVFLRGLHGDPRWRALLKAVNLPAD